MDVKYGKKRNEFELETVNSEILLSKINFVKVFLEFAIKTAKNKQKNCKIDKKYRNKLQNWLHC